MNKAWRLTELLFYHEFCPLSITNIAKIFGGLGGSENISADMVTTAAHNRQVTDLDHCSVQALRKSKIERIQITVMITAEVTHQ